MDEHAENTSGRGEQAVLPDGLDRWNWGAFLLNWIWAIGNSTYIGLLMFVPVVNIVMPFVLGAKGNRWAWANRPWHSVAQFRRVQRNWSIAGVVVVVVWLAGMGSIVLLAGFLLKNSDAYLMALDRVTGDPRAIAVLGEPIEPGWLVIGSIETDGAGGEADLVFSVGGPKGDGKVYVVAIREAGQWRLAQVVLDMSDAGLQIDLTADPV